MEDVIRDKLEHASEIREQIISLSLKHCESPSARNLLRIGTCLGDFTNNLRSALNYTVGRFAEKKLKPILSPSEYKEIKKRHDFPWAENRSGFDNISIVGHVVKHFTPVYQFLEGAQPYHGGNEWLKYLMRISNKEKHEITNEVLAPSNIVDVAFMKADGTPHSKPKFFGDKLLVTSGKKPHFHPLPCYYRPYSLFALKGERWAVFFIVIDQTKLGLTRFIEDTPQNVERLINSFNALV